MHVCCCCAKRNTADAKALQAMKGLHEISFKRMAKHSRQHITNNNHKNINNRHTKMVIINCSNAFACAIVFVQWKFLTLRMWQCSSMKKNRSANDFRKNKRRKTYAIQIKCRLTSWCGGSVFVRGTAMLQFCRAQLRAVADVALLTISPCSTQTPQAIVKRSVSLSSSFDLFGLFRGPKKKGCFTHSALRKFRQN